MGNGLQVVIYVIIAICVLLAIALMGILGYVWYRDNKKNGESHDSGTKSRNKSADAKSGQQGIESMSKFLDFNDIVDSMIVRKGRTQYVMVLQCKGINFDLLGEEEKMAVENGFTQFLNTLRYPVQLYVQSRSLNLRDSIEKYQERINEVHNEILKLEAQIKKESANGRLDVVRKLEFARKRKINILEYGLDVTNYVSRLSQNRNVLQQNTYVAVAYYTAEFGGEISNYSKEEIDNIAFSELYTRAQTLIRALAASGVTARVMDSEELAELLYVAYNRDDSELINIRKAVEMQYDSLYNTAKDVMDKQKEMIERKVEEEAIELTSKSITKADKILKLRQQNKEDIRIRAMAYVERYKGEMSEDLYEETKRQVEKADILEKHSNENKKREEEKLRKREIARKEIEREMQDESRGAKRSPSVKKSRPDAAKEQIVRRRRTTKPTE